MRVRIRTILAAVVALAALTPLLILSARPGGPRSSTRTILRVANWEGPAVDPSFLKLERELLDGFEAANPDIRVVIENVQQPGYAQKLLMSSVAGNPPDVISLDASSAAVLINNGLLADLAHLSDEHSQPIRLTDYFPNALKIAQRGDAVYAVPFDFTPMVMFYNKRMFREAGIPFPRPGWTRDEFLDAARKLTKRDRRRTTQYGYAFVKDMPLWFPWIWAGGGDVLSPDGKHALGYLDSPATIDAIRFLADLVKVHRVSPSLAETAAVGRDLFRDPVVDGRHIGSAAMALGGHWNLIEYVSVDKMDIGVATIPRNSGKPVTVMYESGLAIFNSSPHKAAALRYIRYMTSSTVQKRRLASGLAISGNVEAAKSFAGTEIEDAFLEAVNYAQPPWGSKCEQYELVEDLGREMMEDILDSNVSVDQAVKRMAGLVEAELQR